MSCKYFSADGEFCLKGLEYSICFNWTVSDMDMWSAETNLDLFVGCHFEMLPTNVNAK